MLGSTCSTVMRHSPLPRARAAVTNSRERTTSARPRDAREHRHVEDADRDDRRHQARTVDCRQHDRREQRRKREREVGQAHHDFLDPAPFHRSEQAEGDAEDDADADRDHADRDRDAAADDEQRDDVAAEAVGAEPVRRARRLQLVRDVELGGRVRRPREREQRQADDDGDQHRADAQAGVAPALPSGRDGAHVVRARARRRGSMTT